jgi:beta-phosphoglucomutase family hydrolase
MIIFCTANVGYFNFAFHLAEMKINFAAIFDMDGVIVDNYAFHQEAWKIFCRRHAVDFDEAFRSEVFGGTNRDHLETFFRRPLTAREVADLEQEKEAVYRELYREDIRPLPGLLPFLQQLKQAGVPMALATSSPPVNVGFVLDETGTRSYFDVIMDASHVTHGKPHPEIYLKTAEALGLEPNACLVFEDSVNGINSALRAGMRVIALTTTHAADELPEVDLHVPTFEKIGVVDLENLM